MENKKNAKSAAGAVTAHYDFCSTSPEGDELFSVRAGIPLTRAFEQLSALMSSSIDSVEQLASSGSQDPDSIPGPLWQSFHLMGFAYALVQAMHKGQLAHERGEKPAVTTSSVRTGGLKS